MTTPLQTLQDPCTVALRCKPAHSALQVLTCTLVAHYTSVPVHKLSRSEILLSLSSSSSKKKKNQMPLSLLLLPPLPSISLINQEH